MLRHAAIDRLEEEPILKMCKIIDLRAQCLVAERRAANLDCLDNHRLYMEQWTPWYRALVQGCSLGLSPLKELTRLSVAIPVAAHEEVGGITTCLKAFLHQDVAPELFEIVLFLNHPSSVSQNERSAVSQTEEQVKRFQKDHPEFQVHYFAREIDRRVVNISFLRKILTDTILFRHVERGEGFPDLIVLRTDADLVAVRKELVGHYLRLFECNPQVDAYTGRLEWDWRSYVNNPLVLFGSRLFMAFDRYLMAQNGIAGGGGANFAVRLARYADGGGYPVFAQQGEDVLLGRRIRKARAHEPEYRAIADAGPASRIVTSARRNVAAVEAGYAPVLQWSLKETRFGASNPSIRTKEPNCAGDRFEDALKDPTLNERLNKITNETIDFYFTRSHRQRRQACRCVLERCFGLRYHMDGKRQISITDSSNLVSWLRRFREAAPRVWRERYGQEL